MKNQKGFTLIELIIVIVILGILAVTAAPQFINLSGDARAASLNAAEGSVKAVNEQMYARALIAGIEGDETGTITQGGVAVDMVFGYPATDDATVWKDTLLNLDPAGYSISVVTLNATGTTWTEFTDNTTRDGLDYIVITPVGYDAPSDPDALNAPANAATGDQCYLWFINAAWDDDGDVDTANVQFKDIGQVTTGC